MESGAVTGSESLGGGPESEGFLDLVRLAQEGDRGAMDRVFERLQPHLEPLARLYADPIKPTESTGDLLQESCIRAWQKIDSFRTAGTDEDTFSMFRAWLGQIVRRLGLNARRDQGRQKRKPAEGLISLDQARARGSETEGGLDVAGSHETPSAHARSRELTSRIEGLLARISEARDAEVARLYFFQELNLAEIARRLDVSYAEVRRRYMRAVAFLEKHLTG